MKDEQTLESLAKLPSTQGYNPIDRYHDFRRVFYSSPEGQRVLAEILYWGHMLRPDVLSKPIDPYLSHIRMGERNVALRLLATVNNEPKGKPAEAVRRPVKAIS